MTRATLLRAGLGALALAFATSGCGYRTAHGGRPPSERLSVELAPPRVPRADAVQEVAAGAREELSRAGALGKGGGWPRLVVEVVRIDELSSGVVTAEGVDGSELPLARGSRVAVVARAWVVTGPGAASSSDTGDVRRTEIARSEGDARLEAVHHDDAVRSAARRVGRALARRILGEPEPRDESP